MSIHFRLHTFIDYPLSSQRERISNKIDFEATIHFHVSLLSQNYSYHPPELTKLRMSRLRSQFAHLFGLL